MHINQTGLVNQNTWQQILKSFLFVKTASQNLTKWLYKNFSFVYLGGGWSGGILAKPGIFQHPLCMCLWEVGVSTLYSNLYVCDHILVQAPLEIYYYIWLHVYISICIHWTLNGLAKCLILDALETQFRVTIIPHV